MPTYDYICTSCSNAWELEQRIVEDPVKKCPKCGADTAKRQISSGAGFILKGGGWYADGYGSKKPSTSESNAGDKGSKSATKTEPGGTPPSKGDSKSESKSESKSDDAKGGTGGASSQSSSSGSGSKASAA